MVAALVAPGLAYSVAYFVTAYCVARVAWRHGLRTASGRSALIAGLTMFIATSSAATAAVVVLAMQGATSTPSLVGILITLVAAGIVAAVIGGGAAAWPIAITSEIERRWDEWLSVCLGLIPVCGVIAVLGLQQGNAPLSQRVVFSVPTGLLALLEFGMGYHPSGIYRPGRERTAPTILRAYLMWTGAGCFALVALSLLDLLEPSLVLGFLTTLVGLGLYGLVGRLVSRSR